MRQQAELSLRRLRLDRIDLYQLHRIDPTVPLPDQIGALRRLQDEGKVRHVGLSEVAITQLTEAERITPIVSVQNRYNLVDRASDDVLEYCQRRGTAFIPRLPIARTRTAVMADPITAVAERLGATRSQVALAWLLRPSAVMLPIPGTSSRAHLEETSRPQASGSPPTTSPSSLLPEPGTRRCASRSPRGPTPDCSG